MNENINVAPVDQNLTVSELYRSLRIPSLGRQIFTVLRQNGPVAGIFNLQRDDNNNATLLRKDSEVFAVDPIDTGITQEAAEDIKSQYGEGANQVIGALLRGLANDQENEKTLEFLNLNSTLYGALTLSQPRNARTNMREIAQAAQEVVTQINKKYHSTYSACCVLPAKYAASFMVFTEDFVDTGLFVGSVGTTRYFINPDPDATVAYVVLLDDSTLQSSGYFSEYTDDVVHATDPDSGQHKYFIYNRFALTASPLHDKNTMFYHFTIAEGSSGGSGGTGSIDGSLVAIAI